MIVSGSKCFPFDLFLMIWTSVSDNRTIDCQSREDISPAGSNGMFFVIVWLELIHLPCQTKKRKRDAFIVASRVSESAVSQ